MQSYQIVDNNKLFKNDTKKSKSTKDETLKHEAMQCWQVTKNVRSEEKLLKWCVSIVGCLYSSVDLLWTWQIYNFNKWIMQLGSEICPVCRNHHLKLTTTSSPDPGNVRYRHVQIGFFPYHSRICTSSFIPLHIFTSSIFPFSVKLKNFFCKKRDVGTDILPVLLLNLR